VLITSVKSNLAKGRIADLLPLADASELHRIGHFGDVLPSQSLGLVLKN